MNNKFIHLRLHSAYSLAEGAIKIEKLIELCEKNNMPAVAVTDTNNLFGAMEFSIKCAKHGIQAIIACQLNIQHIKKTDHPTSVLLYVKNKNGYQNLIQLISNAYLSPSSYLYPEISLDLLTKYSQDLILVTGGIYGSLGALLLEDDINEAKNYLDFLRNSFSSRLYIELSRHSNESENKIEEKAISLAYDFNLPLVATNNVCYPYPTDFNSHDALMCIAQGQTIYDTKRETSSPEFYFKTSDEMISLFSDIPEAITNTVNIARRCSFMLEKKRPVLPQFELKNGKFQNEELRDIAVDGLWIKLEKFKDKQNYDEVCNQYFERLEYELSVIQKMGFSGYFLIVADYVGWAKSQNIPVGPGRGSGAGSIVAWAIKITDIDPIRFNLFFERFLNSDRISMPDFDIDFCQERRDEVILYVQNKYGYQSVAQIITFGKLQAKAVVRDVGRVLAIPYGFVDKISKMIPFNAVNPPTLRDAISSNQELQNLVNSDQQVKGLMEIALKLEGLYRHPGVHAAGIVISNKNLLDILPIYKDTKSTMPATQFSMKYIEDAGLIKFDFLGLKTLTVIKKTLDLVSNRGINLTSQDIPLDDKKTFELFKNVNCVGVFQIESGGMRDVLKRLQPDRIEDIIALVALYRPGPMDDIPKYIACKHGIEHITYLHEKIKPILEETYGVMVYQEQVMQIAQLIGGYTLGQADILRRAMGKKDKEEMFSQKTRFVNGAVERGMSLNIAEHLFEQMSKFAGYGFNKCHSTPYGLLTYQTAFLKANYSLEFFAAVMTLDIGNVDKLCVYYQDAIENGIKVTPPDINTSGNDFSINYSTNTIEYSLSAIKGSGEHVVREIVKERELNGNYQSIFDFAERLSPLKILNRRFLENFIKSGVFDRIHPNRKQLLESLDLVLSVKLSIEQINLFKSYPNLIKTEEWNETEKLQQEFYAIGFYISSHPIQQYNSVLKRYGLPSLSKAKELHKSRVVVIINGFLFKTTKTQNKFCILQVSDTSGACDVTMFSETLSNYRDFLQIGNIVILDIVCHKNNDQLRMVVDKIQNFADNSAIDNANDMYSCTKKNPQSINRKILHIKINNKEELVSIKNLTNNFEKTGNYYIKLLIPKKLVLVLPDSYYITSNDILNLRNVVGINNVIEIVEN